jgi:hypothetical protein
MDVSYLSSGDLVVADYRGNRVCVFNEAGTILRSWGFNAETPGGFRSPHALAVSKSCLYVLDESGRVQLFQ